MWKSPEKHPSLGNKVRLGLGLGVRVRLGLGLGVRLGVRGLG